MEFPCSFALKVMVLAELNVTQDIMQLVNQYIDKELQRNDVTERPSRTGKYKSLTITFVATSKQQLDDIYTALSKHEKVRMAL